MHSNTHILSDDQPNNSLIDVTLPEDIHGDSDDENDNEQTDHFVSGFLRGSHHNNQVHHFGPDNSHLNQAQAENENYSDEGVRYYFDVDSDDDSEHGNQEIDGNGNYMAEDEHPGHEIEDYEPDDIGDNEHANQEMEYKERDVEHAYQDTGAIDQSASDVRNPPSIHDNAHANQDTGTAFDHGNLRPLLHKASIQFQLRSNVDSDNSHEGDGVDNYVGPGAHHAPDHDNRKVAGMETKDDFGTMLRDSNHTKMMHDLFRKWYNQLHGQSRTKHGSVATVVDNYEKFLSQKRHTQQDAHITR